MIQRLDFQNMNSTRSYWVQVILGVIIRPNRHGLQRPNPLCQSMIVVSVPKWIPYKGHS